MRETAVQFGSHRGLVGVVTHPADDARARRRAFVMANVGVGHHVGPFRLYVELARMVAGLGWYALRFDLSGLGDSAPRAGGGTTEAQAQADVVEALDHLEAKFGVTEVVLVGLCSGVDAMHPVLVSDPRVIGAVFVDGYTYPTLGYRLRRHTVRYLEVDRWRRYARRQLRRLRRALGGSGAARAKLKFGGPQPVFDREYPSRSAFRADLARAAGRGARMLFIYTGTFDRHYNSPAQLYETLGPDAPRHALHVDIFREADHLLSGSAHRARFFGRVQHWLEGFPGAEGAGVATPAPSLGTAARPAPVGRA